MIGEVDRCIEQRMNGISNDLVDHSAVSHDDGRDTLNVSVENRDQLLWFGAMRHGGKALDVSEKGRYLTSLAAQLEDRRFLRNPANDRRRKMLFEPASNPGFAPTYQRIRAHRCRHEGDEGTQRRY